MQIHANGVSKLNMNIWAARKFLTMRIHMIYCMSVWKTSLIAVPYSQSGTERVKSKLTSTLVSVVLWNQWLIPATLITLDYGLLTKYSHCRIDWVTVSVVVSYLTMHVHDDHGVGAAAHHKVLGVLGKQDDVGDSNVWARRRAQRFERVSAFRGLHIPHLKPWEGAVVNMYFTPSSTHPRRRPGALPSLCRPTRRSWWNGRPGWTAPRSQKRCGLWTPSGSCRTSARGSCKRHGWEVKGIIQYYYHGFSLFISLLCFDLYEGQKCHTRFLTW